MESKRCEAGRAQGSACVFSREDYVTTLWSGGVTTQLAIAPEGAVYAERDFLWRVSSARVEDSESDFTPLPDYMRYLSVLEGGVTLRHSGGESIPLAPYAVHRFDGGAPTHSWGRCTDFNLMLHKGQAEGTMTALTGKDGPANLETGARREDVLLYAAKGDSVLRLPEGELLLPEGSTFLQREVCGLRLQAVVPPDGAVMLCRMWTV